MFGFICPFLIGCLSVTALLNFVQPAVLMLLFRFCFVCELMMLIKFAFPRKGKFRSTTIIRKFIVTGKGMQFKLVDFIRKNNQDPLVIGKCSS